MKIYGQDFRDVFAQLPWQYKIVVAVGGAFVVFVLLWVPGVWLTGGFKKPPAITTLQIPGASVLPFSGVLDPSLAYSPKDKSVWMAFTNKELSATPGPKKILLNVRLARTNTAESCRSWVDPSVAFESNSADILGADGQTVFRSGTWRVETPTLVYDPDDAGREWKLYAYKYFWADDPSYTLQVAQHYGMIVYKYASNPAKGWSTEQWLFSPAPDYPPAPYDQMVLLYLNNLSPELKNIVAYSRPSALYKDGAIVMTLSAFTQGTLPDRVVMIISRDHGNSWLYVGSPLRQADLAGIPAPDGEGAYTRLAGATLLEQEGRVYLAAVPGDEERRGRGTFIFEFEDFFKGTLRRDAKTGAPLLVNSLPLQNPTAGKLGGGFAAYTDACKFGMLTAEQKNAAADFQIFKTHTPPTGRKD